MSVLDAIPRQLHGQDHAGRAEEQRPKRGANRPRSGPSATPIALGVAPTPPLGPVFPQHHFNFQPSSAPLQLMDASGSGLEGGHDGRARLVDSSCREGPCAGSTVVWLHGQNFHEGLSVRFGGVVATDVSIVSTDLIKCRSPPFAPLEPLTLLSALF